MHNLHWEKKFVKKVKYLVRYDENINIRLIQQLFGYAKKGISLFVSTI